MKKVVAIILSVSMLIGLTACGTYKYEAMMDDIRPLIEDFLNDENEDAVIKFEEPSGQPIELPGADEEEFEDLMAKEYEKVIETDNLYKIVYFVDSLENVDYLSEKIKKMFEDYCTSEDAIYRGAFVHACMDVFDDEKGFYNENIDFDVEKYIDQYCKEAATKQGKGGYYDDPNHQQENGRDYGAYNSYTDKIYYYYGDFANVSSSGYRVAGEFGEATAVSDSDFSFRGHRIGIYDVPEKAFYSDILLIMYETENSDPEFESFI